jgi:uncharacterized membrane protein (UPF0127 family)
VPDVDRPRSIRLLWWGIGLVLVLGFGACIARSADKPADPVLAPPAGAGRGPSIAVVAADAPKAGTSGRKAFADVRVVLLTIIGAGSRRRACVLVADNQATRQRGLMEVRDLGGYDGMLFVFPYDTQDAFWMRNTPQPLSIAYLDDDGGLVSTTDMAPCGDSDQCPLYRPDGPYRYALEVPQGALTGLGLTRDAKVEANGPCNPP